MANSGYLISAIGTPLNEEEGLHEEGLNRHLSEQWSAGINGVLIAGSMGIMQMLRDRTYRELVERATQLSQSKGEILIGVGDTSWARTCDRIEMVSRYPIDGVVVLTPQWFRFSQMELVDYFWSLADIAPMPLYLYDMDVLPGAALELTTYETLVKHPNIRGAKISGRLDLARKLKERVGNEFRIIVAEPDQIDELLREGFHQHLDGMFSIAPHWAVAVNRANGREDWGRAAKYQEMLRRLRELLLKSTSIMGAFTAILNACDIPGRFHAAPFSSLGESDRRSLLASPIVNELRNLYSSKADAQHEELGYVAVGSGVDANGA